MSAVSFTSGLGGTLGRVELGDTKQIQLKFGEGDGITVAVDLDTITAETSSCLFGINESVGFEGDFSVPLPPLAAIKELGILEEAELEYTQEDVECLINALRPGETIFKPTEEISLSQFVKVAELADIMGCRIALAQIDTYGALHSRNYYTIEHCKVLENTTPVRLALKGEGLVAVQTKIANYKEAVRQLWLYAAANDRTDGYHKCLEVFKTFNSDVPIQNFEGEFLLPALIKGGINWWFPLVWENEYRSNPILLDSLPGMTPLHQAIFDKDLGRVQAILEESTEGVDALLCGHLTSLHFACGLCGENELDFLFQVVCLLCEAGANPEGAMSSWDSSCRAYRPIEICEIRGVCKVGDLLPSYGAEPLV